MGRFIKKNKIKKVNKNYIDGDYEDLGEDDDKKYEIVLKYIKDLSVEIPNPDTFSI